MSSITTAPVSLAEQAYRLLEEQLVTLALPPGSKVSEGQLIAMTGFGRTPVREAILRLAQQDMFTVLPRKGLVVTPVSRASMVHILEVRKPLERVVAHDSFEDFLKLDSELDDLLDSCAGNPFVRAAVAPLRSHCRRFWYFHRNQMQLSDAISAHSKMARLVARREYNGAQKASDGVIAVMERLMAGIER